MTIDLQTRTVIHHPHLSMISEDAEIGDGCVIHSHVWIGPNVVIGAHTRIQAFAFIPEGVTIGQDCFIGPGVVFTNDRHPPSPRREWESTFVADRASIGAGAVILPGVRIGWGAMVGAGSVVTRDVPPATTVKGNPAR